MSPEKEPAGNLGDSMTLSDCIDESTRKHVVQVLDKTGWERKKAADLLGIDRATLYRIVRKLGISEDDIRADKNA